MTRANEMLAADPKSACESYIATLEREFQPWYNRASNVDKYLFAFLQLVAILAGAGTSVLAALAPDLQGAKWALIVLPLVGALATAIVAQTRAADILALRERGREQFQSLVSQARADFAAVGAGRPDDFTSLHKRLVNETSEIEKQQATDLLSIARSLGAS